MGVNVIGHSETCQVRLPKLLHSNKCYISRRHCTIEVKFDKWTGQLRYILQDGAISLEHSEQHQGSLNGTKVNGYTLREGEKIDLLDNAIINLGGVDSFKIQTSKIPQSLLDSHKITEPFNPEETQ